MKKNWLILLVFALVFSCLTVHATDARLVDGADLLTPEEEAVLTERLDAVSAKRGVDVVIVTADGLDGDSPMVYADDYYDYHDYAPNGILLLVDMDSREYWISTTGSCILAFTDAGIEYLGKQFTPDLSGGNYVQAFEVFIDQADALMEQAESGDPFDIDDLSQEPTGLKWKFPGLNRELPGLEPLIVCAVIAVVFGSMRIGSMKKKMNSVAYQRAATEYVRPGSMNVTLAKDFFLYRTVSRVARPKETSSSGGGGGSSTHISSSGTSHGGGGGRF